MIDPHEIPAFMKWPIPSARPKSDPSAGEYDFRAWHNGRCGMCGDHESINGRRNAVDHDHDTGLIRGMLCTGCNLHEGWHPGDRFHLWRAGMNPCAMFGWHWLYRPAGRAHLALRGDQALFLERFAAESERRLQREEDGAFAAADDLLAEVLK